MESTKRLKTPKNQIRNLKIVGWIFCAIGLVNIIHGLICYHVDGDPYHLLLLMIFGFMFIGFSFYNDVFIKTVRIKKQSDRIERKLGQIQRQLDRIEGKA